MSKKPAEIFLQIGIYLWTIGTATHWLLFARRNFAFGRPFAQAEAVRGLDSNQSLVDQSSVLQVDVTVPRPWHVEAGQFVFLSIPSLGIFTGLRGHPFMICWWERDGKGLKISLLVKSRSGFTAELDRHANTKLTRKEEEMKLPRPANKKLLAFIDGPYGVQHDFGEYGTVIMFATGIGIAGHIPYIKDLIRGYNSSMVKTHRIRLVWELKKKCEWYHCSIRAANLLILGQEGWVYDWMQKLMESDTGYVQPLIQFA